MSVLPFPSNAVVYAQFNLQGRWKRILIIAALYGFGFGATIWLTTLGTDNYRSRDLEGWVRGFTMLQILCLLVFGSFRVETAVRGDISSRMIESHRLMPAPPLGSILGYIFGAPLLAIVLAGVNFILGAICCAISGMPLDLWALVNGILFFFALFVYAMITQFSFITRGGFLLFLIIGGVAISSASGGTLQMLPSANVLLFPMISRYAVFELLFSSSGLNISSQVGFAYLCAVVGQALLGAIAVRIAVRRYTSASTIGLSPILGLLLLATWVALAVVQLSNPRTYGFHRYYGSPGFNDSERTHTEMVAQLVAALITSFLLAMFPIASAARFARERHRTGDPSSPKSSGQISEVLTVMIATAIVGCLLVNIPFDFTGKVHESLLTLLILVNFLTGIACLFSCGYFLKLKAWIFASIWVFLTWVGPIIADGIYHSMNDTAGNSGDFSSITALSPAGALGLIWSESRVALQPGIVGQLLLTLVPTGLLLLLHSRRRNAKVKLPQLSPV